MNKLTLFGSISLGLLALFPIIGQVFLNTSISIGGTSVLILVAVALETMRQIESRALMVTYDDYSTPDFFYGQVDQGTAHTGLKKLYMKPKKIVSKLKKRSKK